MKTPIVPITILCATLIVAAPFGLTAGGAEEVAATTPPPVVAEWGVHDETYSLADARAGLAALQMQTFKSEISAIDFTAPLLAGGNVTLSELAGNLVFLNFWATWCPPCREEMPSMEQLQRELAGLPFTMLAVNVQESEDAVQPFVDEFGYSFPVVLDERGAVASEYGVRGIPTTVVIGPDGVIIAQLMGTRYWDTAEVVDAFTTILAEITD